MKGPLRCHAHYTPRAETTPLATQRSRARLGVMHAHHHTHGCRHALGLWACPLRCKRSPRARAQPSDLLGASFVPRGHHRLRSRGHPRLCPRGHHHIASYQPTIFALASHGHLLLRTLRPTPWWLWGILRCLAQCNPPTSRHSISVIGCHVVSMTAGLPLYYRHARVVLRVLFSHTAPHPPYLTLVTGCHDVVP
jgi:hypothetical protein